MGEQAREAWTNFVATTCRLNPPLEEVLLPNFDRNAAHGKMILDSMTIDHSFSKNLILLNLTSNATWWRDHVFGQENIDLLCTLLSR